VLAHRRGDSAAATHKVIDWLTGQGNRRGRAVQYSIGWSIGEPERAAITALTEPAWSPAINADGGVRRLPSREFAIDAAWCAVAAIAADLIAWLQILDLDGDLAAAEPKRLRYRVLHTAARLTHRQRRRWLRIPATWPWAQQITTAFARITAIPVPG